MSEHRLYLAQTGVPLCIDCAEEGQTTHCPKRHVQQSMIKFIDDGMIDFIDGVWCADNQHKVRSIMFDNMACLGYKDEFIYEWR